MEQGPGRQERPRPKGNDMEQYQEVCRIIRSVPNYTSIFIDSVRGIGSNVKGRTKTKRCKSVSFSFCFVSA